MTETLLEGDLSFLDERTLLDYVTAQRWFGSKNRDVTHAHVLDVATLRTEEPLLHAALV